MIAQRFRPVGWVAGVALAATALYLVSLQVASERGRLEAIDRRIAATKRDIRQLQTEMGTRASLRQLERWNGEVLSLSAPQAGQFLNGESALARVDQEALGDKPAAPPVVVAVNAVSGVSGELVEPAKVAANTSVVAQPKIVAKRSAPARFGAVAMLDRALIDRSALASLAKSEVKSSLRGDTKQ